jgi:hypothetical protein
MHMRAKVKLAVCIIMGAAAVVSLLAVLGSLGMLQASAAEDMPYLVREYQGYVGVFYPADSATPTNVTDIPVSGLPLTDRLALVSGIGAANYGQVIQLLEDFGS